MIVKMKKTYLITMESRKEETLARLRQLGVLHVETLGTDNPALNALKDRGESLEKSLNLIPKRGKKKKAAGGGEPAEKGFEIAASAIEAFNSLKILQEERDKLNGDIEKLAPWGNFEPADLGYLKDKGISVSLFEFPEQYLEQLPDTARYILLAKSRGFVKVAMLGELEGLNLAYNPFPWPEKSLESMKDELRAKSVLIGETEQKLAGYAPYKNRIRDALEENRYGLEYESVKSGFQSREDLAWISGYIPADQAGAFTESAQKEGWGVMIADPGPEDAVPTLIRNSKVVMFIKPVFDLLGIVPGYNEYDISFYFLLFFSLFYAMIVGDGAYGIIMLLGTVIAALVMKKAPRRAFYLIGIMSVSTIVWGAISGTWFGSEALAATPPFSWFVIPVIASYPVRGSNLDSTQIMMNMMRLCLTLGFIHLIIAHVWTFIRNFPKLVSFAEIGKIAVLVGSYFLQNMLVLKGELFPYTAHILVGGVILLIVFADQAGGNFFLNVLIGIAKLPLTFLSSVGSFADIISYLRLFAVGMAGLAVEQSFNGMAAQFGASGGAMLAVSALILLLGHSLNIVMCAMSILVHGIRLNILEFAGHMGMEWSGTEYAPFSGNKRPPA
jgi:V/A-type H+/Na+-transporting ATPase subunit I